MSFILRRFAREAALTAGAVFSATLPAIGNAQDYPTRPITIVVPYPAGSAIDNLMRPLAVELQAVLGQPVLIDNRPGAQGVLGTELGARAKPDGYTLLAGSSTTLAASVGLFKKLGYDPLKDFQPVAGVGSVAQMFMVRSDYAARDLPSFVALARREASPLAAGVGGSSAQVALALFSRAVGAPLTPVSYKGTPQAITDLIGGTIPMAVIDVGNGVPHLRSGRLTALAISSAKRSVSAPNVPTLAESYPNIELVTWIALVAPAGTPMPAVNKLYAAIARIVGTPEMKVRMASMSTDVDLLGPAELSQRMRTDQARWLEMIKAAGIQPE